ncbi:Autophagy-related protein 9 [Cyphellophora attinorum]|uniref:Autophagy-related protein 9 n=1 Tax=Cyphellophora attinorum TaxID=1664694 RepID=A0A0N1P219_9EURO|nr:Autophagy-related protein 9 [Phialophora attinorum]KPI42780.1 Autophagy-related protein 9 [Phialophora attinorum]
MASSLFSPPRNIDNPAASIYETIRRHEEDDEDESEGETFLEEGLEHTNSPAATNMSLPVRGQTVTADQPRQSPRGKQIRPKWMTRRRKLADIEDLDDDVPASLLIEGEDVGLGPGSIALPPPPSQTAGTEPFAPVPSISPPPRHTGDPSFLRPGLGLAARPGTIASPLATADPRSIAMWRWTNVVNLDNFLLDVYNYYLLHGMWSILLRRLFGLLTGAFLVGFSVFLTQCINYHSGLSNVERLDQVLVKNCTRKMSFFPSLFLWILVMLWILWAFQYAFDLPRLRHLHDFYYYLLDISDAELQSISWQEIVSRLMALRDTNPTVAGNISAKSRRYAHTQSKQRMDAHDIANRLMRKENYIIAMVNKEILDFTLPIPFLRNRQLFTRTLEWNINWCIMDFVFNKRGQVQQTFLKDTHRKELSEALRQRFIFAGFANLFIAPFLIGFFLVQSFFTHFNEYQKNPGAIGSREYNVLAEWKFREFNELWHLFKRRINMSHPFASRYIDQFPKDKTIQSARFVAFVSGAVVSVLGMATIFDQENFLALELTPGRTAIFYLGVFGGIWAIARGMIPEDSLVYEPAFAMTEVIDFTHYSPSHWHNRLHTVEVKREFEQLYQIKILMFVEEILSMIFTPFVLWFSLPKCSDRIIDFFREFTVHVDGIGYVCSFAEFKLNKPVENPTSTQVGRGNASRQRSEDGRENYFSSKDQKLEQSYWGFMNDYARNPKADVRFHYQAARKRLNLPPPVPGLPSPTLQAGFGNHHLALRSDSTFSPSRTATGPVSASQHAGQSAGTPLQSMLLDPHHQPSGTFGNAAAAREKTRALYASQNLPQGVRNAPFRPEQVAEANEDADGEPSYPKESASAASHTGSWRYDDDSGDDSLDEHENAVPHDNVGVIGLIRRLQKTQGEGNRAGSGI